MRKILCKLIPQICGSDCLSGTITGRYGNIRLHNAQNYVTFDELSTREDYGKPLSGIFSGFFSTFPPPEGLTDSLCRGIFSLVNSYDEDIHVGKTPREEPVGARLCHFSGMVPLLS